jgi:uracil-DNA glycosylase family 4
VREKPDACKGCPLQRVGSGFATTDGSGGTTGVLVVAEALGGHEAAAGLPLIGPAGKTWDRLVERTFDPGLGRNLQRSDFLLDNCIHCQPPGNILTGAPYATSALDHCRPYLEQTLREFKPRAILTLGNTPLKWFTGQWGIEQLRGYVFPTSFGPVIPTYHPSYIMRGKWNLARVVQLDILKAIEVARKGAASLHVEKAYELSPSYEEVRRFFLRWREAGAPPLAFDIETPRADEASENEDMTFSDDPSFTILMISFSWEPLKAISIPWIEPFISLVKHTFMVDADFLVWNAAFDVPRLMHNGVHFGGRVVDAMLAWHWLEPALPMGLKYVATFFCPDMSAWKLEMHKNFQWYNAADSDVLLRVYQEVKRRLSEQGRWKTFERHFLDFGKVLNRMTERGVTVDHEARAAAREHFSKRFDETVVKARAQAPREILTLHPKRGYKKLPADTAGMVQIEVELTEKEELALRARREREREKAKQAREKAARQEARAKAKAAKEASKAARRSEREARKAASKEKGKGGLHGKGRLQPTVQDAATTR